MSTTTTHVPAENLARFRTLTRRAGGFIVSSSPIGGNRYAVTVQYAR